MNSNLLSRNTNGVDLLSSRLYDNETFYKAFSKDLSRAKLSVVIESPFITLRRMKTLLPILTKLCIKGVQVTVNTRNPYEHDNEYELQANISVQKMQQLGIKVLYTVNHHRKLAIIDEEVLWEGSLNILSQNDSCELMRRSASVELVEQMTQFIGVRHWS
mgnify:FL=1